MMENTAILAPNETVYLTTDGNLATPAEGLRGRLRRYLEAKPTVWMMNLLTFVTGIFLCVAIFLGILAGFSLLRWIGGIVLLFCSVMVVMAAFPIPQIRDIVFRWAMFLAAYNGRGIFTFCVGLLTTIMGPLGVLAGILAMLVGAMHLMMYVYFRDIIEEDYKKIEGRRQGGYAVDQVEVAMEPDPNVLGDFYATTPHKGLGSTYSTSYGSVGDSKATTTYGSTAPTYEVLPVGK